LLIDLHLHTRLSSDSNVSAEQYLEANRRAGSLLSAVCFTEHRLYPSDAETLRSYDELSQKFAVHIFRGVEADTDLGHLLLYGITPRISQTFDLTGRMLKSTDLITQLYGEGGVAVPAHPFRDSGFGSRLEEFSRTFGRQFPAIEVLNGQSSAEQNQLAEAAAIRFSLTSIGGSDAHFATPKWFPICATEFEKPVTRVENLCAELRAGRASAKRIQPTINA
jgi:predicted metal-dependent phosphoesterase TrpH